MLNNTIKQIYGFLSVYCVYRKSVLEIICYYESVKQNVLLKKLKQRKKQRRKKEAWVKNQCRSDKWWVDMLSPMSTFDLWKKNFRMSRLEFQELCDILRLFITPNPLSPNYRSLSAEKKLAVILYFLKDTGCLTMTANTFGIHQSTTSTVIMEVCEAIVTHLVPKYITLPKTREEMTSKVSQFELKFGMLQAYGCIGGTHIPMKTPNENSQDYFNYKQFFSLNVQAVCNYKGYFMDVDCRSPGSCHDAKVYANSKINKNMQDNEMPMQFKQILPGEAKIPNYLIGDPAYLLTAYYMKEFGSCKTNAQVVFNSMLRTARNPIECAFGRLKARWGVLTKRIDFKLQNVPKIILTCFALHNYCEPKKSYIDKDIVRSHMQYQSNLEREQANFPDKIYSGCTSEGYLIRNMLTEYVTQNLPDSY